MKERITHSLIAALTLLGMTFMVTQCARHAEDNCDAGSHYLIALDRCVPDAAS
jgi:hypothetical protein